MHYKHVKHLFFKDLQIEWRQKFAVGSALLYLISTVFITQLVFSNIIAADVWAALFWIVIVFATVNTVSRSFIMENQNRYFYYYTLASPKSVIVGKLLYNNVLMLFLSFLCYLMFSLFFNNLLTSHLLFLATLFLGSIGLSTLLTMTSAIAWKANNSFALTSVLSFPLILPLLLVVVNLTNTATGIFDIGLAVKFLITLGLLNFIIIALTYLLFPYIWTE